jgi:hypothetical protein
MPDLRNEVTFGVTEDRWVDWGLEAEQVRNGSQSGSDRAGKPTRNGPSRSSATPTPGEHLNTNPSPLPVVSRAHGRGYGSL